MRSDLLRPQDSILTQMIRYGIVGMAAFLVDFGVLVFLSEIAGMHYLLAAVWGFLGGLTTNYLLSIHWVFSNRTMPDPRAEFTVFALVGIGGLLVTEVVLWSGTELVGLDYRISKIVAVAIVLLWNFGLRKLLLFRNAPGVKVR
jgi:putative flippase GtrA